MLTAPHILQETFQANDDYYISFLYTNLTRWLRVLGFVLTLTLPAIYVALLTWQQEMLPDAPAVFHFCRAAGRAVFDICRSGRHAGGV